MQEKYISRKENLKKCTSFVEQKGIRYIQGNVCFGIFVFSCYLSGDKCFAQEIKGFYLSSLENEVDFRDIMNISPNNLAKNQNFKKLRERFVDERALITTTLIYSCHCKTLVPFCLRKQRPENKLLTLIVNYHKIIQKNKSGHPKQK